MRQPHNKIYQTKTHKELQQDKKTSNDMGKPHTQRNATRQTNKTWENKRKQRTNNENKNEEEKNTTTKHMHKKNNNKTNNNTNTSWKTHANNSLFRETTTQGKRKSKHNIEDKTQYKQRA